MSHHHICVYCIFKKLSPRSSNSVSSKKNLIRYSPIRALKSPSVSRIIFFTKLARASTSDFFCSALAALVDPVQNILFLAVHYNTFVPMAQQAGQTVVLGRLSLSVCLWMES
jgi:hypothetical protein